MNRTSPACSARLDQQAPTCPQCGANLAAGGTNGTTGAVDQAVRNTAVVAHLSTFAGLVLPFGSVIGPLAVWLTRRNEDPLIEDAGREALNFGISVAIYGLVMLVAALMLIGIPFLIVGRGFSTGLFLRMARPIRLVQSFDITTITMMIFGWEQTARRPRIPRRWWAPPGTHDEENQQL